MNSVKLLLCRGSPRSNIENVEMWNEKLPCDKLLVRFVAEYQAYKIMREFFISNKQYTHMVLATDDIVVRPEHVEKLQEHLERINYPVLSGMMNVNQNDVEDRNICETIGMKERRLRQYQWMKRSEVAGLIDVEFAGFGLTAIRRDIVEDYPVFAADRVFEGKPPDRGASLDFVFCWYCKEKGIPIMVNTEIDMKHLRTSGSLRVGKKHPKVEYWRYQKEPVEIKMAELR